jgi:hypothetical protein
MADIHRFSVGHAYGNFTSDHDFPTVGHTEKYGEHTGKFVGHTGKYGGQVDFVIFRTSGKMMADIRHTARAVSLLIL